MESQNRIEMSFQPFQVNVSDSILTDLRERLKATRWPDEVPGSNWRFGASLSYIKEIANYWIAEFDWRKTEKEINQYPNFIARIDGFNIHFLHVKGNGKDSLPLLLLHGWPGSFLEMAKLIPLLTKNTDTSFDLIIPSLLGYGFSQKVMIPGCGIWLMADLFHSLMKGLGFDKFGIHGGDFGSGVGSALALKYPDHVIGLHLNNIEGYYKPFIPEETNLSKEEIQFEREAEDWYDREGAYSHQQRTKPLTLSYGLNDSPIGLCAWLIEKFYSWSDCNGDIESVFTKDELLSNVTLYWITQTVHSSFRLYYESRSNPLHFKKNDFIKVPVGIVHFPLEDAFPPREYIQRGYNVQHWTNFTRGGHFPALEQPELLATDINKFFGLFI